jgi:predicted nuclease with TOPRIM domain
VYTNLQNEYSEIKKFNTEITNENRNMYKKYEEGQVFIKRIEDEITPIRHKL